MVLNFSRHVGTMAWRRWPSVFQDSVKNTAPRWRMKLPNGFSIFWRPSATTLLLQNTRPQLSPPLATAATVVIFATITAIVPSAIAAASVLVLVLLPPPLPPPRLLLPLLVYCCVLYVSTTITPVAAIATVVFVPAPTAFTVAVAIITITVDAAGNAFELHHT